MSPQMCSELELFQKKMNKHFYYGSIIEEDVVVGNKHKLL